MTAGLRGEVGSPWVVGVSGRSGSGKTTLIARLIPALRDRGLAVGAVKHSAHGFLADRPGKDSYRLYEAGAEAVVLVSAEQRATFTRLRPTAASDPSLTEALAALPAGLDLVLAEGFSWEPIPRLLVVPGSEAPPQKHVEDGEVLRVVRVPLPVPGEEPALSHHVIEALARELASLARDRRRTLECTPAISALPG